MKIRTLALLNSVALISLALPGASFAGMANPSRVINVSSFTTGQFVFEQNGTRVTPPGCAAGTPTRWAVDVTTPAGQATQATILSAFALGRLVYLYGTNTCSVDPTSETVLYITVQ